MPDPVACTPAVAKEGGQSLLCGIRLVRLADQWEHAPFQKHPKAGGCRCCGASPIRGASLYGESAACDLYHPHVVV